MGLVCGKCKFKEKEIAKLREELAATQAETAKAKHVAHALSADLIAAEAKLKAASEQKPAGMFWKGAGGLHTEVMVVGNPEPHPDIIPLYAAPIPPADVQELERELAKKNRVIKCRNDDLREQQERIAELERNLSELAARFNEEVCGSTHMGEPVIPNTLFETAEWPHLERQVALAKAREEGRKEAVPDGWQVVPKKPTEEMWGELARDIVFALDCDYKTPSKMVEFLLNIGRDVPEFFGAEAELKADTSVISKGTRAVLIYKAMLAAAPKPEVKP